MGFFSIHNRNLQVLATDIFKLNRGVLSSIMKNIFEPRAEHLGFISQFSAPLVSTVFHGTEGISFLWPKIQSLLPENFKNIDSLQNFKISIKMWKPENCPFRLCKVSITNVGFL